MSKFLLIFIIFFSVTYSEMKSEHKNNSDYKITELEFKSILNSLQLYKIKPIDSIEADNGLDDFERYNIKNHNIEISKNDKFNIEWIKINSYTILVDKLKSINPRIAGEHEHMFCQKLVNIKLYNFKNDDILFFHFISEPCTGIGCNLDDYLIINVRNKKVNLFGSYANSDLDFYNFPIDKNFNYIATEYIGDFHGNSPSNIIHRVYSMNKNGQFELSKDSIRQEYFYEEIIYPDRTDEINDYKSNWFKFKN